MAKKYPPIRTEGAVDMAEVLQKIMEQPPGKKKQTVKKKGKKDVLNNKILSDTKKKEG